MPDIPTPELQYAARDFMRYAPGNVLIGIDGIPRTVIASAYWKDEDENSEAIESVLFMQPVVSSVTDYRYGIAEIPTLYQPDAATNFDTQWIVLVGENICDLAKTWSEISGHNLEPAWYTADTMK